MPRPNPLSPEEQPQPQSQGIMSPLGVLSESTIELSEDKKTRLKQLQQAREDASGGGLMGHFTYNLLNPHLAYWQAKDEGRFTLQPIAKVSSEEAAKLQKEVPEKLSNTENPYPVGSVYADLFDSMRQDTIKSYEKGTAWRQKVKLAWPAIFEIGQLDFLMPGVAPAGATVGSRPILSNWFKSKRSGVSNVDKKFDAEAIESLLNTPDISKNEQKKEILETLIKDFFDTRKDTTVYQGGSQPTGGEFEQYVLERIAKLKPATSPSASKNKGLTTYQIGYVFENMAVSSGDSPVTFTSRAGTLEQNPAAIAVGYQGVHPFFYSKAMGEDWNHTVIAGEFPKSVSNIGELSTIEPNLGYFGHFRKLNLSTPSYISKIAAYDSTIPETMFAFEIQQDLFKPYKLSLETSRGPRTITATPTTLETQVYILLNKALSKKFYDRYQVRAPEFHQPANQSYDAYFLRKGMEDTIYTAEISEPSFIVESSVGKFMQNFRETLYNKYYFKDGKVNPNFAEEVNNLDPYSFFNAAEAELLKQEFPLTLNEKIISISGKNKDTIATGLIVEAAINKAIQQGDKYIAFPTIHSAEKLQSWSLQGTNLNKFNKAITKNAEPFIKDFFLSGIGNKNTGANYVNLLDGRGTGAFYQPAFNGVLDEIHTGLVDTGHIGPYIEGLPVKNTFKHIDYAMDMDIRETIFTMEYLQLIATNKMPDEIDLSVEKIFKNLVIMGKTDKVYKGKFDTAPRIPEEMRDKFKNPEFLLTLGSYSAKIADETSGAYDPALSILRTIFNTSDPKVIHKEMSTMLQGKIARIKGLNNRIENRYLKIIEEQDQRLIASAGQELASNTFLSKRIAYEDYVKILKMDEQSSHFGTIDTIFDSAFKDPAKLTDMNLEDIMNELHVLSNLYRNASNFLIKNDFFSPTYKQDMTLGYKNTNYGGLVDTYSDKIPNIFKQAGIETEILKVPRMSIAGKTHYDDDAVEEFLRIELTPENIKKLQEYKANLFTKTILPRIKSEENEKNEKIKQYLKDNPLKPGDVI